MEQNFNPFILTEEIPEPYFCDREKETENFRHLISNGHNIVLLSPRRMGKSSLVEHCYKQPEIKDNYYTFYIDILPTSSLAEMVYLLSKKIYDQLLPWGKKVINNFIGFLKSLQGIFGYDAISGMPTFSISSGVVPDPLLTLEELFRYLYDAKRPCIITIDEFQQIKNYPEKNVEALLRSYIQKMRNCRFVFAGSERTVMLRMFYKKNEAFYNSATTIDLLAIPIEKYTDFAIRIFREFDKEILEDSVGEVYRLMEGNTFYMQWICNEVFAMTPKGGIADNQLIEKALTNVLEINSSNFRERLSEINSSQKRLLYVLAQEEGASGILSSEFIHRHQLQSSSSVQYATRILLRNGMITKKDEIYSVSNKLLAIWIRRNILG